MEAEGGRGWGRVERGVGMGVGTEGFGDVRINKTGLKWSGGSI